MTKEIELTYIPNKRKTDLNKRKNPKYIVNTKKVKIISIEMDIKFPELLFSQEEEGLLTFEGYLPTSFKDYEKYIDGKAWKDIKILKGYSLVGVFVDKYTLYLTMIKK